MIANPMSESPMSHRTPLIGRRIGVGFALRSYPFTLRKSLKARQERV
jgi:hypothetical protein